MRQDSHFKSNTISVPTLNVNWFFNWYLNVSFLVKGDLYSTNRFKSQSKSLKDSSILLFILPKSEPGQLQKN